MNLPALQRIAMEFEKENDIMDQRQEMMDDAIDDATGLEDEEESEDVVNQVLDEIGIDLGQAVRSTFALTKYVLIFYSSARPPVAYKRVQCLKLGSPRLSAVEELIRVMTTSRPGWTAYGDEEMEDQGSGYDCPSPQPRACCLLRHIHIRLRISAQWP